MSKELTPLQALEKLVDRLAIKKYDENGNLIYWQSTTDNEYPIIENALKKYKVLQEVHKDFVDKNIKKLKALEIIKEKVLDMDYFNIIADNCNLTYQEYNLLMEVLKWKH